MVNRNSRKLRISIPIENRQSRLHTFSKNIQSASNNHPAYRVSFEYIFLCVNEPWKSAERETEKGKKEIKIARNNRLVSNSLRLPCRILAGSGFDAHLPISPIKYHLPLFPPFSFPSRAREREREEGGGLSQLRAIWREFAADTALKLGRIFLLFLFFISKRRIIEGGRGDDGRSGEIGNEIVENWGIKLWCVVDRCLLYVFVIIKGGEGRCCSKISEELRNVVVTEWRMIGVDGN